MSLRLCAVLGLALAMHASPAVAQKPEQSGRSSDERVIVPGSAEEAIKNFVGQIAATTSRSENQLARWNQVICPSMVGMRADFAQLVLDRIGSRATEIGLAAGEPGCRPSILIIVSKQPDAVAKGLVDSYKRRLGYYLASGKTLGRDALGDFAKSTAPVRWWHVNYDVSADGDQPLGNKLAPGVGMGTKKNSATPTMANRHPSRILRTTRQDAGMAFLIVDARQIEGMDLMALADYLAMASLAQLDPKADTSAYPTIFNLFDQHREDASRPKSLTEWDIAYLTGVYDMTRESGSVARQQAEIAKSMNKDLVN
ncbi:MAG TPA: hypothetical protein VGO52_09165 [Hyphomonadaceae bacterium]|nr:hypothetical protein [Hyphomonadaceae bacterium]